MVVKFLLISTFVFSLFFDTASASSRNAYDAQLEEVIMAGLKQGDISRSDDRGYHIAYAKSLLEQKEKELDVFKNLSNDSYDEKLIGDIIEQGILLKELSFSSSQSAKRAYAISILSLEDDDVFGKEEVADSSSESCSQSFPDYIEGENSRYNAKEKKAFELGVYNFKVGEKLLRPVRRFDVSGIDNNCLFRCFSFVNPDLNEDGKNPTSRKAFMDYVRVRLGKGYVAEYLDIAMRDDPIAKKWVCDDLKDYLSIYNDKNLSLLAPACGEHVGITEASGFPVILAYLSGVDLKVYSYHKMQGAQLLVDYKHPHDAKKGLLSLMLVDGHYSLLAFPGDESKISDLEIHEISNRYLRWYNRIR